MRALKHEICNESRNGTRVELWEMSHGKREDKDKVIMNFKVSVK